MSRTTFSGAQHYSRWLSCRFLITLILFLSRQCDGTDWEMSNKALSHKLALYKAALLLIRCLMIECHAEGREKQVTTWNPECKKEQGPAPRAALDLWTAGKGSAWGNQIIHISHYESTIQTGNFMFSSEDIFQQGEEVGTIRKNRGQKQHNWR